MKHNIFRCYAVPDFRLEYMRVNQFMCIYLTVLQLFVGLSDRR